MQRLEIRTLLTYAKVVKVLLRVAEEAEGEAGVQLADVEAARPQAVEAPVHPLHLPHLLPLHKLRLLALLVQFDLIFLFIFLQEIEKHKTSCSIKI